MKHNNTKRKGNKTTPTSYIKKQQNNKQQNNKQQNLTKGNKNNNNTHNENTTQSEQKHITKNTKRKQHTDINNIEQKQEQQQKTTTPKPKGKNKENNNIYQTKKSLPKTIIKHINKLQTATNA